MPEKDEFLANGVKDVVCRRNEMPGDFHDVPSDELRVGRFAEMLELGDAVRVAKDEHAVVAVESCKDGCANGKKAVRERKVVAARLDFDEIRQSRLIVGKTDDGEQH